MLGDRAQLSIEIGQLKFYGITEKTSRERNYFIIFIFKATQTFEIWQLRAFEKPARRVAEPFVCLSTRRRSDNFWHNREF